MPLPTLPFTPGLGAFINTLQDAGQNTAANSHPVVIANDQSPIPVLPTTGNIATSQVTVGNIATLLIAARSASGDTNIEIMGAAPSPVYVGGPGVTIATGFRIPGIDGAALSLNTKAALYGIVASGTQVVSTRSPAVAFAITAALTGVSSAGAVGAAVSARAASIAGVAASSVAATGTRSIAKALTGVASTGTLGQFARTLRGVSGSSSIGTAVATVTGAGTGPSFGPNADLHGVLPFANASTPSWWNRDVSALPVYVNSTAIINAVNSNLHADFGALYNGLPNGIPYNVVPSTQAMQPFGLTIYASQGDPGPYPIPNDCQIESGSDHHISIIQVRADGITLDGMFEGWSVTGTPPSGLQGYGCKFNPQLGDHQRPDGITSADAAGLPIVPGLVKYDEVARAVASGGDCGHAFRYTQASGYTKWTTMGAASHVAGGNAGPMPFGAHLRLKASFVIRATLPPEIKAIMRTLKRYGMIQADNGGNWFLSGAPDLRWNDSNLAFLGDPASGGCQGTDFELIDNGPEIARTP